MQGNNLSGARAPFTLIHRLDSRTKLLLLAASFVMVLLPKSPLVVALATLAVPGHVTLAQAWRALVPIRWLLLTLALFSLAIWSVMAQGPTRLFWRISLESLAFGVANFLKLGTMMVAGLTLLATTPAEELFLGLVKFRFPYPEAFSFSPGVALGARGICHGPAGQRNPSGPGTGLRGGNPLDLLKRHLPLLAPIFLITLRRSKSMGWALEFQGFQMSSRRTYMLETRLSWRDVVWPWDWPQSSWPASSSFICSIGT
jgi:energy-coupling factor transport system permease protein